ncbi:MAG: hypothetical protein HFI75_05845 [Lachnospiraceae bacterium]|nr:hypothetical protein [Lachnospiraceae bacterium]
MNEINISSMNIKDGKEESRMTIEQLYEKIETTEILEARLTDDYMNGGLITFCPCNIKENKRYLGHIEYYAISEEGALELAIKIDKNPNAVYLLSMDSELYVGSSMYQLFKELNLLHSDGITADIEELNYQRVWVTLKSVDDRLVVNTLEYAGAGEKEVFTGEDFLLNEEE